MGVDCDPDRASRPVQRIGRGVEALPRLFELDGVEWTLEDRADTQLQDYCRSATHGDERYQPLWKSAR